MKLAERHTFHPSPLGLWKSSWINHRLSGLELVGFDRSEVILQQKISSPELAQFETYWKAYWRGDVVEFRVPIRLQGTVFQRRVWEELRSIPHGQFISYRELASRVGSPRAYRAVGSANSKNPLPIVVPCHRVIQSNGSIGGFAFGQGLKKFLIEHETRKLIDSER